MKENEDYKFIHFNKDKTSQQVENDRPDDTDGFLSRHVALNHKKGSYDGGASRDSSVAMNQNSAWYESSNFLKKSNEEEWDEKFKIKNAGKGKWEFYHHNAERGQ